MSSNKKKISVTTTPKNDKEVVYDDGTQTLNDDITTACLEVSGTMANHKMPTGGKSVAKTTVKKDPTGDQDTELDEIGDFGEVELNNDGGQFEDFGNDVGLSEGYDPENQHNASYLSQLLKTKDVVEARSISSSNVDEPIYEVGARYIMALKSGNESAIYNTRKRVEDELSNLSGVGLSEGWNPEDFATDMKGSTLSEMFHQFCSNRKTIDYPTFNAYCAGTSNTTIDENTFTKLLSASKKFVFREDEYGEYSVSPVQSNEHGQNHGQDHVSISVCPHCGSTSVDELGCADCNELPIESELSDEFGDEIGGDIPGMDDPEDFDSMHQAVTSAVMPYEDDDNNLNDQALPFREGTSKRGRLLKEHDGVVMDGPLGTGLAKRKETGNHSGLPEEETEPTDSGKEWPRQLKNKGAANQTAKGGTAGTASDGITSNLGANKLGGKTKNSGGQFEKLAGANHGGVMTGGASAMYENINMLVRHIRSEIAEQARDMKLRSGNYKAALIVSSEDTGERQYVNLTEAATDIEELLQVGADVVVEAAMLNGDDEVGRCEIQMINIPSRGPIVAENRVLFRHPEVAMAFADSIVEAGDVCSADDHNWGASVKSGIGYSKADKAFKSLKEAKKKKKKKK